jgi:transcriptional regulator with XRE-family HTH domain
VTAETELTETLKRCLKARGLTYAALATALKLSEASVKRLFSSGSFTIKRVERICRVLDMDLFELARLARDETPAATLLSMTQERALAENSRLLLVFHLLLAGWGIDHIVGEYAISRAQCIQLMLELDRLQLIELRANNAVRLRTAQNISWRRDGPIRRAYGAQVLAEFLAADFDQSAELLHFEAKELSAASREVICRKLKRLHQEFSELAAIDSALAPSERESVGLVVGVRPYVLSVFTELKRRRSKP